MKVENTRFRIKSQVGLRGTVKCSSGTCSRDTNNWPQSPCRSVVRNRTESRAAAASDGRAAACQRGRGKIPLVTLSIPHSCEAAPGTQLQTVTHQTDCRRGSVARCSGDAAGCGDGARNSYVERAESFGRREKQRGNR